MRRWLLLLALVGCDPRPVETPAPPKPPTAPPAAPPRAPERDANVPGPRTLLLSQAQFTWGADATGKRVATPGPAKLLMLTQDGGLWHQETIIDDSSRVFHKAQCVNEAGLAGVLTIGGTAAKLKRWQDAGDNFSVEELWSSTFGGKWDRLRDFELVDVDGDGVSEIAIATHDQGVVALAKREGTAWSVQELSRKADTFVHEMEVGDVDGDKTPELYVTPSDPNRANVSQSGSIWSFTWDAKKKTWTQGTVDVFKGSHAKEILVTDLDGDGTSELYAAVEAELKNGAVSQPVEVRQYTQAKKGKWTSSVLAAFAKGLQSRVLLAADLTGSGAKEIVVTTMKDGVWRVIPPTTRGGAWTTSQIDAASSGFEHAAGVADLDGDGKPELYVAADDQDEVRRYVWDGAAFARSTIATLEKSDITWNIVPCGMNLADLRRTP